MAISSLQSKPVTWTSVVAVTAALYFAREVFIPIALALLLSFLLVPLVTRLRHLGWAKVPAIITVVVSAFTAILLLGALVTFQLYDLAQSLPSYKDNIQAKLKTFRNSGDGILSETKKMFLEPETNEIAGAEINSLHPNRPENSKPIPVEMHAAPRTSYEMIKEVLGSLLNPLATTGIVVVFVIFMLFQREDLRDRFLRLLGSHQLNLTTQALDDAATRVSRFLLMQLLVNTLYGIPIGVGLYFIGIPNALVWGILAALLRFIPYVGPVCASVLPIALAFAVDSGWSMPIMTITLFVVLELVSNNLIEPWLYGSRTGISSFAVVVAAVFWTWLWGPIGLLLATPLTVCLAVLGRYVPSLGFLHIILGDEPVLSEGARFYQRLLAGDSDEASEIAESILKKHNLEYVYDSVILSALSMAELERHQRNLDEDREKYLLHSTREIVEDLGDAGNGLLSFTEDEGVDEREASVLCLPANDEADELCCLMLVQLLRKRGVRAKVISSKALLNERLQTIRESGVSTICVSALPPSTVRQARLFCKRIRAEFPDLTIIMGVWTEKLDQAEIRGRFPADLINHFSTSLSEAVEIIHPLASTPQRVLVSA